MLERDGNLVFREVQRWGLWFRGLLAVSMLLATAGGIYATVMEMRKQPSNMEATLILVCCGVFIPLGLMAFFWVNRLETEVRSDGVYVRFFPLHFRFQRFAGEDLSECFARKYRPIWEYGGWGIRYGWRGGRAYNVSGSEGVQLVFKTGKRLLIGSKEPAGLEAAICSIMANHDS